MDKLVRFCVGYVERARRERVNRVEGLFDTRADDGESGEEREDSEMLQLWKAIRRIRGTLVVKHRGGRMIILLPASLQSILSIFGQDSADFRNTEPVISLVQELEPSPQSWIFENNDPQTTTDMCETFVHPRCRRFLHRGTVLRCGTWSIAPGVQSERTYTTESKEGYS
ncbi:hypothetical protein BDY19DRAFT_910697 [Irpex rosettiformis]|uniref:Uncharacterized protein n=1 Tax=Irpex rosettiformis TaxID=378272 RepID=A0ACB8TMQ9_9APHY|nr:hypothetical protein BDY19DRAFT_910697 [Irpex rosettiformis]